MTDTATIARDNASHCEVKKHALRQTQDGIVVAFVVHPNDVPPALQLAPLGTRYMLALVEIGEDEQPKAVAHDRKVTKEPAPDRDAPARAPRKWGAVPYPEQAGIRLGEPAFVKFVGEHYGYVVRNADDANNVIKELCHVDSKRDIKPGSFAGDTWAGIDSAFCAWQLAPQVGAA